MKEKKKTVDHLVQDYCLTCQDQRTAVRPTDANLVTADSLLQDCLCDLSEPDSIILAQGRKPYYGRQSPARLSV